jgi:hypothetical protein
MLVWGTLVLQQPREVRQTTMEVVAGSQARAMPTNRAGSTGDVNPLPSHACTCRIYPCRVVCLQFWAFSFV